ncbi:predicted protein [Candida tropicalis MYA-3404]|nr:predicted protein [Candida tropicalis MYA-3404]EER30099.1 predicted protein [Candida tropicalis MYA-3404]KAG4404049.1 hypothetical protein JTP64_001376 [Candida tropicalis]
MKKQNRSLDELTFVSFTGIWGSIYSIVFLIFVLVVQFWTALFPIGSKGKASAENFFQNYLGAVVISVFYLAHKLYSRRWRIWKSLDDIDLDTGRRNADLDLIKMELEEEKLANKQKSFLVRMFKYWC